MLDFRIDTFLAVCQYMNFTRAAAALNITQPAVTQHIHYLEELYQAKLFTYENKKLLLTSAGQYLKTAATTMKHDSLHLASSIRDLQQKDHHIPFGVTKTIGDFLAAPSINRLLKLYPDASLTMEVANTEVLLARIDSGAIDFAVIEGYFPKSRYDSVLLSEERFIPACSPSYHFAAPPACLSDLLAERLLVRETGSGTRQILEQALTEQNLHITDFPRIAEIGSMVAIKELAQAGAGITFLYEAAVLPELACGALVQLPLTDFHVTHALSCIWNKDSLYGSYYRKLFLEAFMPATPS